jgi:hypothetical protein
MPAPRQSRKTMSAHERASRQLHGRAVWSAGRPGAEGGPVDQLLGAAVEGAGLQQVEVEVAGTREDRLVPRLGGDYREHGDLDPVDEAGGQPAWPGPGCIQPPRGAAVRGFPVRSCSSPPPGYPQPAQRTWCGTWPIGTGRPMHCAAPTPSRRQIRPPPLPGDQVGLLRCVAWLGFQPKGWRFAGSGLRASREACDRSR